MKLHVTAEFFDVVVLPQKIGRTGQKIWLFEFIESLVIESASTGSLATMLFNIPALILYLGKS